MAHADEHANSDCSAVAAVFFSVAVYLLVFAFRGVDISVVSPFRYTLLLWGVIAGYRSSAKRRTNGPSSAAR